MYEILAGKRTVNGIPITTWKREITNANILEVEVGSTGFQGGDTAVETFPPQELGVGAARRIPKRALIEFLVRNLVLRD